ncbi:ataxin-2-like isoform X4 [Lytechinus variegatus]|uniref:ataxin-2-like isoform X4 n=1 Tax=Lytechinus variegatus TaxID=7654 RepID=UPI001BB21C2C|nr:ataxin-2-like isoform X4 [Lytechinus variegatus]
MNNRRSIRDRDRVVKTNSSNTGRANRGSARNSVPQNASPPTTSLKSLQGLYANQHFVHVASVAKGCTAELQVKSGKKFEGILTTVSPMGEVELRLAHPIDSSDNSVVPTPDLVTDKMLFKSASIVCINIKDVDMEYASKGADAFQTDGEISSRKQNGQVSERELEAFESDANLGDLSLGEDPLSSGSANGWSAEDMFRRNEQMGVKSSYDSNLGEYTTPLEMKDTDDYQRKVIRANQLAKKIEGSSDYMVRIGKELETTEEDRFSAVVRPMNPPQSGHSSSSSPVSASSNEGHNSRYVPPALRNKQDGPSSNSSGGPPGHHHRNHQRATPPPVLPLHSAAGRNRAQSPHMHPPHQQSYQTSPHNLPSPQQRVQTPPHGHPAARNQQMPMQMQQSPQQSHMAANPRSPVSQPPLPQRLPSSGRRTAPDMGNPIIRSPVQSNVPAPASSSSIPAAAADKPSNIEKSGAGPQDVDKKASDVTQAPRIIPTMDRSPRAANDSSKKQTIENLKEFGDNFMLQDKDKAGAATAQAFSQPASPHAATATQGAATPSTPTQPPQEQQQQQQQQGKPAVPAAAAQPLQPSIPSPGGPVSEPATSAPSSSSVPPVVATTQTPITSSTVAATATSTMQTPEKVTTPTLTGDEKKDAGDVVKKSTLNPNAKEFNPLAKPFVPRMQPQKTPTPPRPPSQPSPAPQVIPGQAYSQQLNQPILGIPLPQPVHYTPIRGVGPRKGATNLPQIRSHGGQHDIHMLPVSIAAGQPLVAPVPTMLPFTPHQAGPGGGPVSSAQPINHTQVLGHNPNVPYVYNVHQQKAMGPRLATQQNMVAAGQAGGHSQHQISQDPQQVMVFPQMIPAGISNFQHPGNIPISQQTPSQMPTPYHQFSQPQPHQNPTVQYQHQQPHQQSHQQHPHNHQHTTPPLSHTPQGQSQGSVMQQAQAAHGGRPSPSPVNQAAMHQANQQQQQQPHQQQHQQFHPQNMQAMGQQQQQNHQMMAAMVAANQQSGGNASAPHATNNHNQQQNIIQPMHPHPQPVIHQYPHTPHAVANITNVTPVHSSPHPHPKPVFLSSNQGQHGGGAQPINIHGQHGQQSILTSPVQGPYMQTQPGQLQQAQVQQFQPNN